jgi:hypothetical protein
MSVANYENFTCFQKYEKDQIKEYIAYLTVAIPKIISVKNVRACKYLWAEIQT